MGNYNWSKLPPGWVADNSAISNGTFRYFFETGCVHNLFQNTLRSDPRERFKFHEEAFRLARYCHYGWEIEEVVKTVNGGGLYDGLVGQHGYAGNHCAKTIGRDEGGLVDCFEDRTFIVHTRNIADHPKLKRWSVMDVQLCLLVTQALGALGWTERPA